LLRCRFKNAYLFSPASHSSFFLRIPGLSPTFLEPAAVASPGLEDDLALDGVEHLLLR
jgi:hypothetical protein